MFNLLTLQPAEVVAQGSCSTAVLITGPGASDTVWKQTYQVNGSEFWLKFVADTMLNITAVRELDSNSTNEVHTLILYENGCGGLQEVHRDTIIPLWHTSLNSWVFDFIPDSTYYIKLEKSGTDTIPIEVSHYRYGRFCTPNPACEYVQNGDFELPVLHGPAEWIQNAFGFGFVPCWFPSHSSPDLVGSGWDFDGSTADHPTPPGVNSAFMAATAWHREGVWTRTGPLTNEGNYILSFWKRGWNCLDPPSAGTLDNIFVEIFDEGAATLPTPVWTAIPGAVQIYTEANVSDDWEQVVVCFTIPATGTFDAIRFYPEENDNGQFFGFLLDHVELVENNFDPGPAVVGGSCEEGIAGPATACEVFGSTFNWYDATPALSGTGPLPTLPHGVYTVAHEFEFATTVDGCAIEEIVEIELGCPADLVFSGTVFSSVVGSNFTAAAGVIRIEGQFVVNTASVTFDGVEVILCPGAGIEVQTGNALTITGQSHFHGCNAMWDRILVRNNGTITIDDNSLIEDAEVAVETRQNVTIDFNQVFFNRNNVGLWIANYTENATMSASIINTAFVCVDALVSNPDPGFLAPPYPPGTRSRAGIIISNQTGHVPQANTLIPIGQLPTTSLPDDRNVFVNLDQGIEIYRTNVVVLNNLFASIPPATNPAYDPMISGIYFWGTSNNTNYNLTIGDPADPGTEFYNVFGYCERGIHTENHLNLDVYHNEFVEITNEGMFVDFPGNGYNNAEINIVNNTFDDFENNAIHVYRQNSCDILINGNIITGNGLRNATDNKTGIRVWNNSNLGVGSTTISEHEPIEGVQIGVRASQVNDLVVTTNVIRYAIPSITQGGNGYGVWIQNCPDAIVSGNGIFGDDPANPGERGIEIEESPDFLILENSIATCGFAINVIGDNNGGNIVCNIFDDYNIGVGLEDVEDNLGPVTGTLAQNARTPSDNQWLITGQATWDIDCYGPGPGTQGDDIIWAVQVNANPCSAPDPYVPCSTELGPLTIGSSNPIIFEQTTGYSPCMEAQRLAGSGNEAFVKESVWRDRLVTPLIQGYNQADLTQDLDFYRKLEYFFWRAKKNPSILTLGEPDDQMVQNLFQTIDATSIGKFFRVDSLARIGEFSAAKMLLTNIQPVNSFQENKKTVLAIFIETLEKQSAEESTTLFFEPTQEATLEYIAGLNPREAGSSVFMAQTMLFKDVSHRTPSTMRIRSTSEQEFSANVEESIFQIYPNPATSEVNLIWDWEPGKTGKIEIYNLQGLRILSTEIVSGLSALVSISDFPVGLYFVRLYSGEDMGVNQVVRLVIQ